MHGKGKISWVDGRCYEGDYQYDKKHGYGTFYWPDGRKYVGYWKDGKQHGRGEYYLPNGDKKTGEWVEGKKIKWIEETPTADKAWRKIWEYDKLAFLIQFMQLSIRNQLLSSNCLLTFIEFYFKNIDLKLFVRIA